MRQLYFIMFLLSVFVVQGQTPELFNEYWSKAKKAEETKDWQTAAHWFEQSAIAEKKSPNPRQQVLVYVLSDAAYYFEQLKNYDKAFELYNEAKDVAKQTFGKDHENYGFCLYSLGKLYYLVGKYEEGLPIFEDLVVNVQKTHGENIKYYGFVLNYLANINNNLKQYDKAIENYKQVLKVYQKTLVTEYQVYKPPLENLASIYKEKGMFNLALPLYEELVELTESQFGKQSEDYAFYLLITANLNKSIGNYEESLNLYNEVIENIKSTIGKEHPFYGVALNNLSICYKELGQFGKAISIGNEALVIAKNQFGENHEQYGVNLFSLADVYFDLGNLSKALELYTEALNVIENSDRIYPDQHCYSLNSLGLIHSRLGSLDKASDFFSRAKEIAEKQLEPTNPNYSIVIHSLGGFYMKLGQHKKAVSYYIESLNATEKTIGKLNLEYSIKLNSLGDVYKYLGQVDNAALIYNQSLNIIEQLFGKKHPSYANRLNNLAVLYAENNQYNLALPLYKESIELTKELFGENHIDYASRVANLALLYHKMNQIDIAEEKYLLAKKVIESLISKNNSTYFIVINNLARLYEENGEFDKAYNLFVESNTLKWSEINSVFLFGTEQEKYAYFKKYIAYFETFQSFDMNTKFQFSEVVSMNLNNQYLLKGLLMRSYSNLIDDLSEVEDVNVQSLIDDFRNSHSLLSKQITKPIKERQFSIDSLQVIVQQKEASLIKKHKELFNVEKLLFDWKTVQNNLNSDEVVVEFSKFHFRDTDDWTNDYRYVAYVFDKSSSTPKPIYLFKEKELKKVLSNSTPSNLYDLRGSKGKSVKANTSEALFNLIWKPIEAHFEGKKTIYFAPDGLLNQLALAALPDANGETMLSKYNLYQMSNTANLVQSKSMIQQSPAIFVGGIQYDFSPKENSELKSNSEISISINSNSTRSNQEGTWQFLSGTEQEANKLNELYQKENQNTTIIKGENATEKWFKNLSGRSPKVLHLATHGFFFEDVVDTTSHKNQQPKYTLAKDPLLRSGLVLAHGNYTWKHGNNPYKEEDGILTAYEISRLDFQNTDLVVLSACETGLGDISGSEGVYGLQRAFKMAGVNTIIMSLWEVPDKETSEFMQLFYTNWLSNKNIRQAFIQTQRTMATQYKDAPEKWAAFVLVE